MKEIGIQGFVPPADVDVPSRSGKATEGSSKSDFGALLEKTVGEVERLQQEAGRAAEAMASGQTESIHETMIALKKAELSFKMMMQVRNKIVKAYEEVMRMQV